MTYSSVHEYSERIDAYARKLGYCAIIDRTLGSPNCNPQFLVRIYHTGDLRVVDMVDLKLYGNPGAGENLIPDIPRDWLTKKDLDEFSKGESRT